MSVQSTRSLVHSESGIALLGTVLVAALVLGLAAWGVLNVTSNAQQTVYRENAANQARTAALMGIQAVTGYAQSIYVGNAPLTTSPLMSQNGIVDQSFTQPTNANVQAMIVANTFSGTASTGYIKMLSTGRSGSAIQTAEAYLTAQMSTLYNNKYSVILGGTATLHGAVQNDTSSRHERHKIYVGEGPSSKITVRGNTTDKSVVYLQASSMPIINPNGLEQYATILLVNGIATIPEGAVSFYVANNFLPPSTPLTSSYSCSASSCPKSLSITYKPTSPATWSIGNVPAFIYSNQDINVNSSGIEQLTVASTGDVTTSQDGVRLYPFGSLTSGTTTNYCKIDGNLPICNPQENPIAPYSQIQGLIYVVSGNNYIAGKSDVFYGDIASAGELSVSGAGSDHFGGTIVAEGGYTGTKGILKILNPVASANSATLGGYKLTASSIRWVP